MFGRRSFGRNRWQVILHNTGTGHNIVLADVRGRNVRADPGQVNGNWAVWDVCGRACSVYRYDLGGRTKKRLPNTLRGRLRYAPSVAADGTAYYAHSGAGCGANVRLVEKPVGAPAQVLVAFKRGVVDISTTSAVADQVSGTDVYYDRFACRTRGSDIYKVVVP